MAYENITLQQANFCLGPQSGTICTIDSTNVNAVLRVKNTAGATIKDYSLSSNIVGSVVGLEYVGPHNLTSMVDGLIFFTFEKVSSTTCLIKRWETRVAYSEIVLKEQITKSSSGDAYYDVIDFAIEYYSRYFTMPNEGYTYLNINDTKNLKLGTKLILGPSTDTSNLGAIETVSVSHVAWYIGGERVYLTSPIKYQYAIDDKITFYSHVYIYSQKGYAGDDTKGTLFKLDAYSWSLVGIDTKALYKKVTSSRWCPLVEGIASIVGTNMFFVRPYDLYLNWRSAFLNNVSSDNNTPFMVYDVVFDDYTIYKLQDRITLRNDSGIKTTTTWSTYNYQQDTILPYTNSINLFQGQSIVTGYEKTIDIDIQVRDQYFVGLKDVNINLYKSGDDDAEFIPLNGQTVSDSNGDATIEYTSGSAYTGHTNITGKVSGSSTYTGSQYVWNSNNIISYPTMTPIDKLLFQLKELSGYTPNIKQIYDPFKVPRWDDSVPGWVWGAPSTALYSKSFFMTPGGDWGKRVTGVDFYSAAKVLEWLPLLYRGADSDAPRYMSNGGFEVSLWDEENSCYHDPGSSEMFIGNQIKLVNEVYSENTLRSLSDFVVYYSAGIASYPFLLIVQPTEAGSVQLSQLKLAHHTYWLGGVAYDYLWTYVDLDQFVFVEDAVPKFWSGKNPKDTNIWLRLRPFAFSLNNSTLKMWVREVSYYGDTGYVEVTENIDIINFDAGGTTLGIELTYNPTINFLHNSIIFVRIEVYDTAPTPNFIYTEYWFEIIPDYKAPYLTNLSPSREAENVYVDSTIYFEIKDDGAGIDIESLEVLLNSRLIAPTIEMISDKHYKVSYTPSQPLYYDKAYKVTVKVNDTSPFENGLNDAYIFYTTQSDGIVFTDFDPVRCKRGMQRFQNISLVALADGNGIDENSITMQIFNKDITPKIIPIIYRIS